MTHPDEVETTADSSQPYNQWVQSILSLDSEAWTKLHEIYSGALRFDIEKSLRRRELSLELVDDIEQETWLTAIRRMREEFIWVDEERFYHWLRCIALNHVRTYGRKLSGYVSFDDFHEEDSTLDDFMDTYVWSSQSVEDEIILRERLAVLDRVLRTLPTRDGEILMRRVMGETPRELAAIYHMKPETLRMVLWRTKEKIESQIPASMLEDNSDD